MTQRPKTRSRRNGPLAFIGITLSALFVLVMLAAAWHGKGHMAVAAVAYDLLSEPIKERVAELLALNPSSDYWDTRVASVPTKDRPKLRFVMAAVWPDDIKNDKNYTNEQESDSRAGRNIGYKDHLQHRYWHYVDHPLSDDGSPTTGVQIPARQCR